MKLVDKITAPLGQAKGSPDSPIGGQYRDPGSWDPELVLREGMLQGEPPRAQTGGWGDLSWFYWRRWWELWKT
jgi:hypothetical protein